MLPFSSSPLSRRALLRAGGAASFVGLWSRAAQSATALQRDAAGVFELPPGFTSRVLDTKRTVMSDGYLVPAYPDGMACFPGPNDTLILMRNHEVGRFDLLHSAYRLGKLPTDKAYDATAGGGVTRLVLDAKSGRVLSSNLVLTGTVRNCSGGKSPWGWLSCEETVDERHGYVFLCDTAAASLQAPVRIPAYGRFNHEAATVDPKTGIVFLTEDRGDSCFYRFVPTTPGALPTQPSYQGRLQALVVEGQPGLQTGTVTWNPGDSLPVTWVDIVEVDPARDTVRVEGHQKGAAYFSRGEGLWLDGDDVYFSATTGGPHGKGQIFRLRDAASPTARLELVAVGGSTELDMPDNITVAPWGDLFASEDGAGGNSIRLIKPTGEVRTFANCISSPSELTGICFDPAGQRLFVNVFLDGLTMVIEGPFREFAGVVSGA